MLKKLLCPQCGGNDLQLFGDSAYKCEACGTILKEEEKEQKPSKPSHYVAPVTSEFLTSEERYSGTYTNEKGQSTVDGDTFIKTIAIIGGLAVIALALIYLFS